MILGITGYGSSGSSAVTDYLKGFKDVNVFDQRLLNVEFQILHEVDGVNDLKYYLTRSQERVACNTSIQRFQRLLKYGKWGRAMVAYLGKEKYDEWCEKLMNEIVSVSWLGFNSAYDAMDISNCSDKAWVRYLERKIDTLLKVLNKEWCYPPMKMRYFSFLSEYEFDSIIAKELLALMGLMSVDENKINIFDMLFSAVNPTMGMEYFDNAKCIIVDRDPRDLYALGRFNKIKARFMPNNDVTSFIEYYKKIRSFRVLSDKVLAIQYEDMIYKYLETTQTIKQFLRISNMPENEFEYFDPIISEKYTNITNLYNQIPDEIRVIERELKEYLYDFKKAISPKHNPKLVNRDKNIVYHGLNADINNLR